MRLAVTCFELLQIDTHFMGRRTLPCIENDCPGCQAKKPRRYEAYVSGVRGSDSKHLIYALTGGAVHAIIPFMANVTQLRGHIITLTRSGTRPNGMLRAEVDETMLDPTRLPQAPNLLEHMYAIWGLDQSHLGQDEAQWANQVRQQMAETPSNDHA